MAPRANWKGYLRIAELTCPVALYAAVSASERISFRTINRATGHPVSRQYVDSETGKVVERDDQVKGYDVGNDVVVLEPEEVAAAVPESDKALTVEAFVPCAQIDTVYFDKPYYLRPADKVSQEAYDVIREAMREDGVAALARAVLFRRVRTVLIRAYDSGLAATTLNFDYEVRPASEVFDDLSEIRIDDEMLDLARHIIGKKTGSFDPSAFRDRYEGAVADLVKAKMEGRAIERPKAAARDNVVDLRQALRDSAEAAGGTSRKKAKPNKRSATSRKAS